MMSRVLLLSVASVSSFAVRARAPMSQTLRMPVRMMAGAADDPLAEVQAAVASDKVVIFSKTTCPFCRKTKDLFDGLGTSYTAVEIDQMDDGPAIQDALLGASGQQRMVNARKAQASASARASARAQPQP